MNGFDFSVLKNRPQLLLNLRKKPSWRGLCESLRIEDPYDQYNTAAETLYKAINVLRGLGILEFEGNPRVDPEYDSIRVSQTWTDLQTELGLSLHDLAKICSDGQGLAVTPLFGRPPKKESYPDIFVIMPFKAAYDEVYREHIKKVANKLAFSIERADERLYSGEIMKEVWGCIFHAKVVLAECTEQNANVFYELGIVHALGKRAVMIRMKGKKAPFNIAGLRWVEYEPTPPGMALFEGQLEDAVKLELARSSQ